MAADSASAGAIAPTAPSESIGHPAVAPGPALA
eukprot:CAMPEP_0204034510 /NCGR_PEP_ID=MMETSP0360-20130528/74122_1 /ASSEMBLY_ACC=CAM_ASM_000342 /TAXON_ID=268821 /ORGANISM="Scrippsiella Hangoei, Strain SHTV-5" /LENGTH=32 /DNA_ID= /DNA_START= /DNA_END= /DNA_ORIENTATION=